MMDINDTVPFSRKVATFSIFVLSITSCASRDLLGQKCSKRALDKRDEPDCSGGYAWICSHLNLDEVPTVFPKHDAYSRLCLLDLSWNNLTTIPSNSFKDLKDLRWLWLNKNNISKLEPGAFNGLPNLLYLNLSTNALQYPLSFSKDVFKSLIDLKYLNLKNNPIKSFDNLEDLLFPLLNLTGLLISGCYNCTFGNGFRRFSNLTSLSLSGALDTDSCNISILFNGTFSNVPNIVYLYLSFCNIRSVEPGSLVQLKNLQVLDISYNRALHFSGMKNVLDGLSNSCITKLDVSAIHEPFERGTLLATKDIAPIKDLQNLTLIYMELNKLEVVEEGVFDLIPSSLSHFILTGNRLTYGEYVKKVVNMQYIVYLDLSRQHLNFDPFLHAHQEHLYNTELSAKSVRGITENFQVFGFNAFKDDESEMMYPDLVQRAPNAKFVFINKLADKPNEITEAPSEKQHANLHLDCCSEGMISPSNITCVPVPQNLETLMWRASFIYFHIYGLKICKPNSLRTINVSFNLLEVWEGPVYGLEDLEELNLAENVCTNMSTKFFDNFYNLRRLNISHNFLGQVLGPRNVDAGAHFRNLRNLQNLDLSENRISTLPKNLFENLESLQILIMSRNMLTCWNYTLKSKYLRLLNLSDNKLETIPEYFRNYLNELARLSPEETCNRTKPLTLDLTGNPIQCNCENKPFLRWLFKSNVEILLDTCHLSDGSEFSLANREKKSQIIDRLDTECVPYAWIGTSVGVFLFSLCTSGLVYRTRWKLRHWYYSKSRRYRHKGYNRLFERDAFISYAQSEANFIKDKLVPSLEIEHDIKVWVADRDAAVGASTAENLTHAIYSSKKSVLILSRGYLKESWCNYEMNMARVEAIESQRQLMIIVLFEEIPAKHIPLDYLRLLKTVRSIEYPSHPQDLETFWTVLSQAIHEE